MLAGKRGQVMTMKMIALAALGVFAATSASAQAVGTQGWVPNLSGVYRCVHHCAGRGLPHIIQTGWQLSLTDETGQPSVGWIQRPGFIWVEALKGGAVYSPSGFTIQFNNGSVWVLLEPTPIPGANVLY
jgi:hypothetical protein